MSIKEIYTNAIQKVIDGSLTKEELVSVFEEHITIHVERNADLIKQRDEYERRYKHLLEQVNSAHKEHEKMFGKINY